MSASALGLTDQQANAALATLVSRWAESNGMEVLSVWQALEGGARDSGGAAAMAGSIENDAALARTILAAIAEGGAEQPARWAREAIEEAVQPKAHLLDPASLAIIGVTLIGLVLAARVKKVGSAEFFKGVPAELTKLVKAATKAVSGS